MAKRIEDIKILVFSVPSWNSKVGANSWATFLSKFDPKNIACVCLREETPDSPICSRYYVISENRVIKSAMGKQINTGYEVLPKSAVTDADDLDVQEHNARYKKYQKHRRYSMLMARELVWKLGKWQSKDFENFLDCFQPDLILHSMDGYIHMNNIVSYAINRTGAKSIGYVWDDNFTYKLSNSIGFWIYRFFQRLSLKKLARITDSFFAISDITKQEADNFFKINSTVITKPLNTTPVYSSREYIEPYKIIYTGSLIIGRDDSLRRLIKQLDIINSRRTIFLLDVYTNTALSEEEKENISRPYCIIHGAISQNEVFGKQHEADILLFLEAIDGKFSNSARLSFSTKITDYLSAGKTILAIGNSEGVPIRYFSNNDSALVCSSEEQIANVLERIVENPDLLNEYARKCCDCGIKNHNSNEIQSTFDRIVLKTVNG
ncbi:MAG: hypothetical protein AB9858_02455 [Acidaminococcaceae bacterium]